MTLLTDTRIWEVKSQEPAECFTRDCHSQVNFRCSQAESDLSSKTLLDV